MKRAADAARAAAARYVRVDLWNGFVAGDPVRVAGIRGGRFRFRCHVENRVAGTSWIELDELEVLRGSGRTVAAGDQGDPALRPQVRRVRAFAEERVTLARVPRRRAGGPAPQDRAAVPAPGGAEEDPSQGVAGPERSCQLALFDSPRPR